MMDHMCNPMWSSSLSSGLNDVARRINIDLLHPTAKKTFAGLCVPTRQCLAPWKPSPWILFDNYPYITIPIEVYPMELSLWNFPFLSIFRTRSQHSFCVERKHRQHSQIRAPAAEDSPHAWFFSLVVECWWPNGVVISATINRRVIFSGGWHTISGQTLVWPIAPTESGCHSASGDGAFRRREVSCWPTRKWQSKVEKILLKVEIS